MHFGNDRIHLVNVLSVIPWHLDHESCHWTIWTVS